KAALFLACDERLPLPNPQCCATLSPPLDVQAEALRTITGGRDDALQVVQAGGLVLLKANRRLEQLGFHLPARWITVDANEELLVLVKAKHTAAVRLLQPLFGHDTARLRHADVALPRRVYLIQRVHEPFGP